MATSLGIIVLFGLISNKIFSKLNLPGLLGMIMTGALIGPYGFNLLSSEILMVSEDLRKIALIVILLRAGLGINKEDLKKVGRPAFNMSFIPVILEGFTILFVSMKLFDFTFIQGGILGFIIAAVSPAVIVPSMLDFMERGIGKDKNIPTLILAGASIDDVFAITIFSVFMGMYGGGKINIWLKLFSIPLSIFLGIILGIIIAIILIMFFKKYKIVDTKKILIILSSAILLTTIESLLENRIKIAGFLGVMTMGFIITEKTPKIGEELSRQFNKIWTFTEILLFILVGAQVNIALAIDSGSKGVILILIGLLFRSIGVGISLLRTNLNIKERFFCILAYTPKATVQAAIGGIPLAMGVESGELILSLAVLSIVLTAPLGSIAIKIGGEKLL